MAIGTQYVAPTGFGPLVAGEVYHDVGRSRDGQVAHLACVGNSTRSATLVSMSTASFECARARGQVVVHRVQATLPPWLTKEGESGTGLKELPCGRIYRGPRVDELVNYRRAAIAHALLNWSEILAEAQPLRALNAYAVRSVPIVNPARYRTWVLTFLCFGEKWALPPARPQGKWKPVSNSAVESRHEWVRDTFRAEK